MTDIVIFGGTGYAGGHIAAEALGRGHRVTSVSRHLPRKKLDGVDYRTGSISDLEAIDRAASDSDTLVIAVHASAVDGGLASHVPTLAKSAIRHHTRLAFVGGAASSRVSENGPRLLDTPDFREEWKDEATSHAAVLDALGEASPELDWFYVSPAALFGAQAPGQTTGSYRTGGDVLVTKDDGSSEISGTDFALAFVDEIERRAHVNQRFTVGH